MDPIFNDRRYLIPFRSTLLPQIFTDTLVIGGGVAGCRSAIAAAGHGDCILLAKADLKNTNTAWAQGGVAGVIDATKGRDSVAAHVEDTLTAGAGLCDRDAVEQICRGAQARLQELIGWGAEFDRDAAGAIARGLEGGHSAHRILHANGDATGREIQRAILAKARSVENLRIFENCFALDLITPSRDVGAPVMGAVTHHPKYGLQMIWAKATILATGGAGVIYRETTNPPPATADGLALAYRAGATLADMAFVQFHPTCLYLPGASRMLISEAVRGEGAFLVDAAGQRFMTAVHPMGDLAPRDIVASAIVRQIAKQGGAAVHLDCRHVPHFADRFPGIAANLKRFDLDPAVDLIPVHPAAHYMVGGVRTDLTARTDVPGLYAVGEAAACGLHGANRLASNSLLEGLVMGEIAGRVCAEMKGAAPDGATPPAAPGWNAARQAPVPVVSDIRPSDQGELDLDDVRSSLRSAMWKNVGLERTAVKLRDMAHMLDFWARYTLDKIFDDPAGWEVQNMLLVAAIMARSALWREESRGCHLRTDFPSPSRDFAVHDGWRKGRQEPRPDPVR
jgi:L-aspartate oxidase